MGKKSERRFLAPLLHFLEEMPYKKGYFIEHGRTKDKGGGGEDLSCISAGKVSPENIRKRKKIVKTVSFS